MEHATYERCQVEFASLVLQSPFNTSDLGEDDRKEEACGTILVDEDGDHNLPFSTWTNETTKVEDAKGCQARKEYYQLSQL